MISDDRLKEIAESVTMEEYDSAYITLEERKELAQELLQRRQAEQLISELEFVDDECLFYADSPQKLASRLADDQLVNDGKITVGVRVLHPGKRMRVWLTGGKKRELHWEWAR